MLPDEQIQMVIHPDGRVTDAQPHRPDTPFGVPPATRAQGRHVPFASDRIAAEVRAARHAGRRPRYQVVVAGVGLVAAAVGLVVVWHQRVPVLDPPADAVPKPAAAAVVPEQPVLASTRIRPFAVSEVRAAVDPGVLRLSVTAQRRTTARVVVTPLEGAAGAERLRVAVERAVDQQVTVLELSPGRYEWTVDVPGQPRYSGVVRVPETPVEVVTVAVRNETPASDDDNRSGTGDGQADVPRPIGVGAGPDHPVDPDGD